MSARLYHYFLNIVLDTQANKAMDKITQSKTVSSNEMMILVLKAQANHIVHLKSDLHGEMKALRVDMDKRFEQVDKRLEQSKQEISKRFEQSKQEINKRFESLTSRIDRFMIWSFSVTIIASGVIITTLK